MNRIGRNELLLLSAIVLFAAGFRLAVLNRPFERDPEGCGAFYGLVARNFFRYDLSQSLGVPIISMGQGAEPIFYANHPPTTPLLIAAVHGLSGYRGGYEAVPGEWQTRLPAAIFTVGCIILLYVLLRRRASVRAALLASALFAAVPMSLLYGGQPDVINTQLVFFALLTVATYERFSDQPGWKSFGWLVLAFGATAVMDWPAFYLVPVLGLHYVCTHRPQQWPWIIGFGLVSTLIFAALYAQLAIAQDDWNWMASEVQRRTGGETDSAESITLYKWFHRAGWISKTRHTLLLTALAPIWLVLAVARRFNGPVDRFATLVCGWAALHVVIGRQGVFQHEWWWWPVTPALVIAVALGIDQLMTIMETRGGVRARAGNIALVIAIALFAGWNMRGILREMDSPKRIDKGGVEFSLRELGEAIRQNIPPDRSVLLAESDASLGLWYYADRALKRHVWDPETLQTRLAGDQIDLSFEAKGRFPHPAGAMIVPKSYVPDLAPLLNFLDGRYLKQDLGKFLLYTLNSEQN